MTEEQPETTPHVAPDDAVRVVELEARLLELEVSTRAQLVRAELKAEAVRAGMVDLDGLKLIDAAALNVGPAGEVEGAGALMEGLKRDKPWLFGRASSSNPTTTPPAQLPRSQRATEMSYAEWQAARRELLKRR